MNRLIGAAIVGLAGLILAGISLANGQPIVALALALSGIYLGLGLIIGIAESLDNPNFKAAAALIGLIGIVGVFTYNRAFDVNIQQAHAGASSSFSFLELQCRPMTPELRDIQNLGIKACALQGNSDQMSAVVDLAKGLHLGPALTLADSAASLGNAPAPDYCARAYSAASAICPAGFSSLSPADRKALLHASK